MSKFEARNPRQLDLCLRLLYSERVPFAVEVVETNKGKIIFSIDVTATEDQLIDLGEKYRILIS